MSWNRPFVTVSRVDRWIQCGRRHPIHLLRYWPQTWYQFVSAPVQKLNLVYSRWKQSAPLEHFPAGLGSLQIIADTDMIHSLWFNWNSGEPLFLDRSEIYSQDSGCWLFMHAANTRNAVQTTSGLRATENIWTCFSYPQPSPDNTFVRKEVIQNLALK